jgi:putative ABC transport system permease protein
MPLTLLDDIRQAVRGLIRRPSFAVTATLTMAVGIGAATAIFSVAYATLLRPLPFKEPGRLMLLHLESPGRTEPGGVQPMVWSYPKYELLRQMQRSFEDTATFRQQTFTVSDGLQAERVYGEVTGPSYFALLGIEPSLGVDFSALERERPRSALLGHGLWMRRFGGDPTVIGRPLTVNGEQYTIDGVLPPGFQGLTAVAEVWLPVWTLTAADRGAPLAHNHGVIARLRRDVSQHQAEEEIAAIGLRIDAAYPRPFGDVRRWGAFAQPLDDARLDTTLRRAVVVLACAAGCLLLMACANLAARQRRSGRPSRRSPCRAACRSP